MNKQKWNDMWVELQSNYRKLLSNVEMMQVRIDMLSDNVSRLRYEIMNKIVIAHKLVDFEEDENAK